MLPSSFFFLAMLSFLGLSSVAGRQPPHLRHRSLARSVRQVTGTNHVVRALVPKDSNHAHREAHRAIKRSIRMRQGSHCTPKSASASFAAVATSAALPSSTSLAPPLSPPSSAYTESWASATSSNVSSSTAQSIQGQQAWAQGQTSSTQWLQPSSSSTAWPSQSSGGSIGATVDVSVGDLLDVTDDVCGPCDSSDNEPNGAEAWLDCGVTSNTGWTPPVVTIDQLIVAELDNSSVFSGCTDYIDMMKQVGQEYKIPAIFLASFAMQESSCNPGATGPNGEQGLMQVTPANCPSNEDCYDPMTNLRVGTNLLQSYIQSSGGNIIQAIGQQNGWSPGMTLQDVENSPVCTQRQNLDYLTQMLNSWMQNKAAGPGTYSYLMDC